MFGIGPRRRDHWTGQAPGLLGHDIPVTPLQTGRPSITTRPVVTGLTNLTGVIGASTQSGSERARRPGQSVAPVQRVALPDGLESTRTCTGIAAPVPNVFGLICVRAWFALPVLVNSLNGSHRYRSYARAGTGEWQVLLISHVVPPTGLVTEKIIRTVQVPDPGTPGLTTTFSMLYLKNGTAPHSRSWP